MSSEQPLDVINLMADRLQSSLVILDVVSGGAMADEENEYHTFRAGVVRDHEERLTGYRALLARIESAAADVQMASDDATTGTASQFTDDLRYLIGLSEELLNRFRRHDTPEKTDTSS